MFWIDPQSQSFKKQVPHFFADVVGLMQLIKNDLQNAEKKTIAMTRTAQRVWEKKEQCSFDMQNLDISLTKTNTQNTREISIIFWFAGIKF